MKSCHLVNKHTKLGRQEHPDLEWFDFQMLLYLLKTEKFEIWSSKSWHFEFFWISKGLDFRSFLYNSNQDCGRHTNLWLNKILNHNFSGRWATSRKTAKERQRFFKAPSHGLLSYRRLLQNGPSRETSHEVPPSTARGLRSPISTIPVRKHGGICDESQGCDESESVARGAKQSEATVGCAWGWGCLLGPP